MSGENQDVAIILSSLHQCNSSRLLTFNFIFFNMNAQNHREAQDSSSLEKFLIWTWLRCGIKGCPFSEQYAQKQHFVGSEKIQLIHTYGNSCGHPNPLSSSLLPLHKLQKYCCENLPRQNASQRQSTKPCWGPALHLSPLQP